MYPLSYVAITDPLMVWDAGTALWGGSRDGSWPEMHADTYFGSIPTSADTTGYR